MGVWCRGFLICRARAAFAVAVGVVFRERRIAVSSVRPGRLVSNSWAGTRSFGAGNVRAHSPASCWTGDHPGLQHSGLLVGRLQGRREETRRISQRTRHSAPIASITVEGQPAPAQGAGPRHSFGLSPLARAAGCGSPSLSAGYKTRLGPSRYAVARPQPRLGAGCGGSRCFNLPRHRAGRSRQRWGGRAFWGAAQAMGIGPDLVEENSGRAGSSTP